MSILKNYDLMDFNMAKAANVVIKPPFGPDKKYLHDPNSIFVFGSNLAGAHGGGAAATALKKYGAIPGQGFGLQGESYAIPTKDHKIATLRFTEVAYWIEQFHKWAMFNEYIYNEIFVTKIGCGLAGFTEQQIAPLFKQYSWHNRVTLPTGWR